MLLAVDDVSDPATDLYAPYALMVLLSRYLL